MKQGINSDELFVFDLLRLNTQSDSLPLASASSCHHGHEMESVINAAHMWQPRLGGQLCPSMKSWVSVAAAAHLLSRSSKLNLGPKHLKCFCKVTPTRNTPNL